MFTKLLSERVLGCGICLQIIPDMLMAVGVDGMRARMVLDFSLGVKINNVLPNVI